MEPKILSEKLYDWIVVGGGISGIAIAEILCRDDKSVLLIEKNDLLAAETSKQFHEWVHSGALYTLAPDNLLTLRYLLGATDDLLQFYGSFTRMNLIATASGVHAAGAGWFNNDRINFRYRVRKLNPVWTALVSRSISIIETISKHDWLRRKAGSEYGHSQFRLGYWRKNFWEQMKSKNRFYNIISPDMTMNSRMLLQDLIKTAVNKGLEIIVGQKVTEIKEISNKVQVTTEKGIYHGFNAVVCSPDVIANMYNLPIKTGFAPMAIVENVPDDEVSFVELDYYIKTCINLLKKDGGIGQAGGITVNTQEEIEPYLNYVIAEHKKRNPSINVIDSYVGIKKELVNKGQDRNYLYHINQSSDRIWSIVLGKFTLAFSMAPEFFRRVYNKNPTRDIKDTLNLADSTVLSETTWQEIANKKTDNGGL